MTMNVIIVLYHIKSHAYTNNDNNPKEQDNKKLITALANSLFDAKHSSRE